MNTVELFRGKGPVDEHVYTYLKGGMRNPFPGIKAKRNKGDVTTSRILLKGLVWLVTNRVRCAYYADGALYAEVMGSDSSYVTCCLSADGKLAYVPHGSVNYYLSVLLAVQALKDGGVDYRDAVRAFVATISGASVSGSDGERKALVRAGDELYYAAAFGDGDPATTKSRLDDLLIMSLDDLAPAPGGRTNVDLSVFMPGRTVVATPVLTPTPVASTRPPALPRPATPAAPVPAALATAALPAVAGFVGTEAPRMLEALRSGERVLALGLPGTGKTKAARLAATALGATLIVVEGHRGFLGSSLIGSIKPVIKPNQNYEAMQTALKATAAMLKDYHNTIAIGAALEAATLAMQTAFPSLPTSARELVPGPFVRALRQGRDKTRPPAFIFFDEFTRVPEEERDPLLHLCNEYNKEEMSLMGVDTSDWPGPFYALSVPETGEIEWAPCKRVYLVCAGNNDSSEDVEPIAVAASRRFHTTIYFRAQTIPQEMALLREEVARKCLETPSGPMVSLALPAKMAQSLVEFADHTRKQTTIGSLNTGSLIAWGVKVARVLALRSSISVEDAWALGLDTWSRLVVGENSDGYPNVTNEGALKIRFQDIWKRNV